MSLCEIAALDDSVDSLEDVGRVELERAAQKNARGVSGI